MATSAKHRLRSSPLFPILQSRRSSGCGKTTLLKLINRLLTPTSGSIEVDGKDIDDRDPIALRRTMRYVFQGVGLFFPLTEDHPNKPGNRPSVRLGGFSCWFEFDGQPPILVHPVNEEREAEKQVLSCGYRTKGMPDLSTSVLHHAVGSNRAGRRDSAGDYSMITSQD